jgi:hypothetical protein
MNIIKNEKKMDYGTVVETWIEWRLLTPDKDIDTDKLQEVIKKNIDELSKKEEFIFEYNHGYVDNYNNLKDNSPEPYLNGTLYIGTKDGFNLHMLDVYNLSGSAWWSGECPDKKKYQDSKLFSKFAIQTAIQEVIGEDTNLVSEWDYENECYLDFQILWVKHCIYQEDGIAQYET